MKEAVISLGTNLFDREKNLADAISALKKLPETTVQEISHIYETKPFQTPDKQDDYLNCCVKINTNLSPEILLGCCLGIEAAMGRKRPFKNAARIIDMDLLLYQNVLCNTQYLTLPHPRITERAFVLAPLRDLYPDQVALGLNFEQALKLVNMDDVKKTTDTFYEI